MKRGKKLNMKFLLCGDEYVNVTQITSIRPYVRNPEYSVITTSDGRERVFEMKTSKVVDEIKEEV